MLLAAILSGLISFTTDVSVDWNGDHQTITGWGASGGNNSADGFLKLSRTDQERLCDLLFDRKRGIGLTMVRNEIYAWDISPMKGTFDWSRDAAQVWLMREAKRRGANYFWSAVWSPPAWMKDNGKKVGGSLRAENYQAMADLLCGYVNEYRARFGLDIRALSVTNEPEVNVDYQSCHWTGDQLKTFVGTYLGPTLAAKKLRVSIVAPESCSTKNFPGLSGPMLADPVAKKFVGVLATHQYDQSYTGAQPIFPPIEAIDFSPDAAQSGKELWQTEVSFIGGKPDLGMKWGLGLAILVHNSVVGANTNAWL